MTIDKWSSNEIAIGFAPEGPWVRHSEYLELEAAHARERAALLARVEDVPEGCTPADAMALRRANHTFVDQLVAITSLLKEHPVIDGEMYDGPCACAECLSYATDDAAIAAQGGGDG